jgi:hypothetical protein
METLIRSKERTSKRGPFWGYKTNQLVLSLDFLSNELKALSFVFESLQNIEPRFLVLLVKLEVLTHYQKDLKISFSYNSLMKELVINVNGFLWVLKE